MPAMKYPTAHMVPAAIAFDSDDELAAQVRRVNEVLQTDAPGFWMFGKFEEEADEDNPARSNEILTWVPRGATVEFVFDTVPEGLEDELRVVREPKA